jgi:hypothetical protein
MHSLIHANWGTIFAATTSVIAVILGYLSFRGQQSVRRQELSDRHRSQARLVTAWWTRVRKDNDQDLSAGDLVASDGILEAGYRIWVSNSSDDAIYDCEVIAWFTPTPEAATRLAQGSPIWTQYVDFWQRFLAPGIGVLGPALIVRTGTVPPKQKFPFRLDPSLVEAVGILNVIFRDANGVEWTRSAGKLIERLSENSQETSARLGPRRIGPAIGSKLTSRWFHRVIPRKLPESHDQAGSEPDSPDDGGVTDDTKDDQVPNLALLNQYGAHRRDG